MNDDFLEEHEKHCGILELRNEHEFPFCRCAKLRNITNLNDTNWISKLYIILFVFFFFGIVIIYMISSNIPFDFFKFYHVFKTEVVESETRFNCIFKAKDLLLSVVICTLCSVVQTYRQCS